VEVLYNETSSHDGIASLFNHEVLLKDDNQLQDNVLPSSHPKQETLQIVANEFLIVGKAFVDLVSTNSLGLLHYSTRGINFVSCATFLSFN
jgi:hypothetical protein